MRYRLHNLHQIDIDALREQVSSPLLRLMLLFLKTVPGNTRILELLDELQEDIDAVAASPNATRHQRAAFTYIINATDVPSDQLRPVARRLGPTTVEELMITTADRLRAEGHAEGRTEGQADLLLTLLTTMYGPLPDDIQARIKVATTEQLQAWTVRVPTANSLDDVLG